MSRNHTLLSRLGFADTDKKHGLHDLGCEYLALPENTQRLAGLLWPKKVTAGAPSEVMTMDAWRRLAEEHLPQAVQQSGVEPPRYFPLNRWVELIQAPSRAGRVWWGREAQRMPSSEHIRPLMRALAQLAVEAASPGDWSSVMSIGLRDPAKDQAVPLAMWARAQVEAPISKGEAQYKQTIGFADVVVTVDTNGDLADGRRGVHYAPPRTAFVEVKAGPVNVHDAIRQLKLYAEHAPTDSLVLATVEPVDAVGKVSLKREGILHIRLAQPFHDWVAARHEIEEAPDIEF